MKNAMGCFAGSGLVWATWNKKNTLPFFRQGIFSVLASLCPFPVLLFLVLGVFAFLLLN
jgi:hypothetical protein